MSAEPPWGMYPRMVTPTLGEAPGSVALIYVELLTYRNQDGLAWPSNGTLANRTGFDLSTVKRAIRWLKGRSLIRPVRYSSTGTRVYYMPLKAKELPIVAALNRSFEEGAVVPPPGHACTQFERGSAQPCHSPGGAGDPQTDHLTEEEQIPLCEIGEQILTSGLLGPIAPKDQTAAASKLAERCKNKGIPARDLEGLFQRALSENGQEPLNWLVDFLQGSVAVDEGNV
jgi:hypothetical protein